MRVTPYLVAYLGAGLVMAGLDAVWLTLSNQSLYRAELGPLLTPGFRLAPAVAFYMLYLVGVTGLAVRPNDPEGGVARVAGRGALLGLVAYGTYDLTNQATLSLWSVKVTALDLTWGTFLTAVAASGGRLAACRVSRR